MSTLPPGQRRLYLLPLLLTLLACGVLNNDESYENEYYDDGNADAPVATAAPAGSATGVDRGAAGTLAAAPCPIDIPGEFANAVTCSRLTVPEDWANVGGRQIRLPVAVLATGGNSGADPLVYLAGGPGDNGLADVDAWFDLPYTRDRDVILLDQRGTGHAEPTLNCPELETEDSDGYGAAQACHDRLLDEDNDLSQYDSAAASADLDALRRALGYDKWYLIGVSYGTRLALTTMRDYPAGLRGVVLDSVYPPHVDAYSEQAINALRAFETLFQACAADVDCDSAFPELEAVFYELVEDLDANPVDYDGADLTGADIVNSVFQAMYDMSAIPALPLAIYDAYDGYYELILDLGSGGFGRDHDEGNDSEGLFYSVECHEEIPFNDYDLAVAATEAYPQGARDNLLADVDLLFEVCAFWGAGQPDPIEDRPVSSPIPTLLLVGEYDPITPTAWAASAADFLPNSYTYTFPGVGHAVLDSGACAQEIIAAFLDNPNQTPDSRCIASMTDPYWELP